MTFDPRSEARAIHARTTLLSFAFAFGVLLFAGTAQFLSTSGAVSPQFVPMDRMVEWAVAGIAAVMGLLGRPVRGLLAPSGRDASAAEIGQKVLGSTILAAALHETTGLIGGFIILNGGEPLLGWALAGLSTVLLITGGPDREAVETQLRRSTDREIGGSTSSRVPSDGSGGRRRD